MGDGVWVEGELLGRVENNVAAGVPAFAPLAIGRFVPRDPAGWVLVAGATGSILLFLVSVRRRSPRFAWASAASAGAVLLGLACTPTGLEFYWIYTDQIGFPVAMTNTPATPSQAKVIGRASYEPFGLATEELDPGGDGKQVRMSMRLPGQWWDFATALHDNFFRTYDPATGRYLEADPIGQAGGVNQFVYVRGNPISSVDPTALDPILFPYYFTQRAIAPLRQGAQDLVDAVGEAKAANPETDPAAERFDLFFHCRALCEANQLGALEGTVADAAALARELRQAVVDHPSCESDVDEDDLTANAKGSLLGIESRQSKERCADLCKPPPSLPPRFR